MESKKYNKLVNITKKEADSQMLPVAEWRGNLGGEGIKRHKLLGIKIIYKDTLCNTGDTANIL